MGAGLLLPAPNAVAPGVGLEVLLPKSPAREVLVAAKAVAAEAPAPKVVELGLVAPNAVPPLEGVEAPNAVAPPVGVEAPNDVAGFAKVDEGVEAAPKAVEVEVPKAVLPAGLAPKVVVVALKPVDGVVEPKAVVEALGVPKVVPLGFEAANAAAGELAVGAVEVAPNGVDPRLAKLVEVGLAAKPVVAPPLVAVDPNPLLAGCVVAPNPVPVG